MRVASQFVLFSAILSAWCVSPPIPDSFSFRAGRAQPRRPRARPLEGEARGRGRRARAADPPPRVRRDRVRGVLYSLWWSEFTPQLAFSFNILGAQCNYIIYRRRSARVILESRCPYFILPSAPRRAHQKSKSARKASTFWPATFSTRSGRPIEVSVMPR